MRLVERASGYRNRIAVKSKGLTYRYEDLLAASERIALDLLSGNGKDLRESRIAYMVSPGFDYVSIQWGIWRAGGVAVPICVKHPLPSIQYVIEDTGASVIIFSGEYETLLRPLTNNSNIRFLHSNSFESKSGSLPKIDGSRRAMILYTSGTTGLPKGVVLTHRNIEAQVTSLTTAWEWREADHILNVLPLHHTHGIINVVSCALWSGACCEFLDDFDPAKVLEIFTRGEVNVFMAVPTIYFQLIACWDRLSQTEQKEVSRALKGFRLMVSGSAALPISVMKRWKQISGHDLLERYGMTEIGMAISNPYRGERKPGHIGQPLGNVQVRIVDEHNHALPPGSIGEIQVKGENVFAEYWNKVDATREAFTQDGWFKTGDIAVLEGDSYKMLGRDSVDIIKSGGYKISALEVEEVLRSHPKIKDCGVVGIPDIEWGEIIGASLILKDTGLSLDDLKEWLRDRLPGYKIPRVYMVHEDLPRNVMGKVTKNELKEIFMNAGKLAS